MDSYKIKQGKFSILEMEGKETECLPPHYLLEYEDVIDEDDVLRIVMQHPTRRDLCQSVNEVCKQGIKDTPKKPTIIFVGEYLCGMHGSSSCENTESEFGMFPIGF